MLFVVRNTPEIWISPCFYFIIIKLPVPVLFPQLGVSMEPNGICMALGIFVARAILPWSFPRIWGGLFFGCSTAGRLAPFSSFCTTAAKITDYIALESFIPSRGKPYILGVVRLLSKIPKSSKLQRAPYEPGIGNTRYSYVSRLPMHLFAGALKENSTDQKSESF